MILGDLWGLKLCLANSVIGDPHVPSSVSRQVDVYMHERQASIPWWSSGLWAWLFIATLHGQIFARFSMIQMWFTLTLIWLAVQELALSDGDTRVWFRAVCMLDWPWQYNMQHPNSIKGGTPYLLLQIILNLSLHFHEMFSSYVDQPGLAVSTAMSITRDLLKKLNVAVAPFLNWPLATTAIRGHNEFSLHLSYRSVLYHHWH